MTLRSPVRSAASPAPRTSVRRLGVIYPSGFDEILRRMLGRVGPTLPAGVTLEAKIVSDGTQFIIDEAHNEAAAAHLARQADAIAAAGHDAIVIAGICDPGVAALRARLPIPVIGIGEASLREAGSGGRTFSVVTITHHLHDILRQLAEHHGAPGRLASLRVAGGAPERYIHDPVALAEGLLSACMMAIEQDGAQAVVIGGAPLTESAQVIARLAPVPIIEPVAAGVRAACQALGVDATSMAA